VNSLDLATAFATVVGLIANFRQEQSAQETLTVDEFLHWLNDHRHATIRAQIENNTALLEAITRLLAGNRDAVLEEIRAVNQLLAGLLAHARTFADVTRSVFPEVALSDQAVGILRILVESGGEELIMVQVSGPRTVLEVFGKCGINYPEPRFLEDDLDALCHFGFVTRRVASNTQQCFRLTRAGLHYIQSLSPADSQPEDPGTP
jgi:hypothetical protein